MFTVTQINSAMLIHNLCIGDSQHTTQLKILDALRHIYIELFYSSGACVSFVMIFPLKTYRFATRELEYFIWWFVDIGGLQYFTSGTWIIISRRVCRFSRVNGELFQRNAMDSTGDSSVVSPCLSQGSLYCHE